ncbi:MAG: YfhO family protein [Oscillospiraceae bacterium]|nr:YfhO family protein [Oscillospiraceae bacterium]
MANTYIGKENRLERRVKGLFTENAYCFLAFGITALLMLVVAMSANLIPFGNDTDGHFTVLRMDLYHQYGPLYAELYDRVVGLKSLVFSWNTGLGGGFLGNFYNYVCSPLTLVTLLLGRELVVESISLIILLNAACSAAAFTFYLKKARGVHSAASAGFGILYALSGWFIAYYWNVMWLDGMTLLPLVALGVEQVIGLRCFNERGEAAAPAPRKSSWLLFSLSMSLFTSYYIGYMNAIFAAVYFFAYYFAHHSLEELSVEKLPVHTTKTGFTYTLGLDKLRYNLFLRTGTRFALTGLASGGLAAFALLPVWYTLKYSAATGSTFPQKLEFPNKIFDFISNHFASLEPTIRSSGDDVLPNVYAGVAVLLLVPLFLFAKRVSSREKVAYCALLAFMFLSMNTNILNYVWHAFKFPNDLPFRFSFIYSFILLIIAFRAFQNIKDFGKRELITVGAGLIMFIVFAQALGSKNFGERTIWITLAFGVVYIIVFGLLRRKESSHVAVRGVTIFLLCVFCAEAAIASTAHYEITQRKVNFAGDRPEFVELKNRLDKREGTDMYRMELSYIRARMEPAWFGYNGVSTFSSMAYEKTSNLQSYLGMHSNFINSYTYNPQTPIYNAMHALRYVVFNNRATGRPEPNKLYYQYVDHEDKFHAYENLYSLPVAFGVSGEINEWLPNDNKDSDPFSVQNDWFAYATGEDYPLTKYEVDQILYNNISSLPYDYDTTSLSFDKIVDANEASITVTYTVPATQNVYMYAKTDYINLNHLDTVKVTSSDEVLDFNYTITDKYVLDLGECKEGTVLTLEFTIAADAAKKSGLYTFYVYGLEHDIFQTGFERLQSAAMNVTSFEETAIEGKITLDENGVLFTSIPYDRSWKITVNGESVTTGHLGPEALIAIPLEAGESIITMSYVPEGLWQGVVISLITVLVLILYFFLERLTIHKKSQKALLETIPPYLPTTTPKETLDILLSGDGGSPLFSEMEERI